MVDTVKVLGQIAPAANALTTAYTVPAATSATISSIVICNTNIDASSFRISIRVNGASDTIQQYLYYDLPITGNDTFIATCGFTLSAGDIVSVQGGEANLTFNIFGIEL